MTNCRAEDKITAQNSLSSKLHNAFNTNGFFSRRLSNAAEACQLVKSATKALDAVLNKTQQAIESKTLSQQAGTYYAIEYGFSVYPVAAIETYDEKTVSH